MARAVILGWAGSTPRQLRAVAGWYRRRELTPLVTAPRVFRAMALPWGWDAEGARVARQLLAGPDEPTVVHAFSNAGFWTYAALLRVLKRRRPAALESIRRLVLDSAPGFPERFEPRFTARYSAMAMMPLLLQRLGRPPALAHPVLSPALTAFMRAWYHLSPIQIRQAEESLSLVRATGAWPILALYSAADTLVPVDLVEAFLDAAREQGRDVHALRWEDSEHVRHMLVHRHAYFDALAEFVDVALAPA